MSARDEEVPKRDPFVVGARQPADDHRALASPSTGIVPIASFSSVGSFAATSEGGSESRTGHPRRGEARPRGAGPRGARPPRVTPALPQGSFSPSTAAGVTFSAFHLRSSTSPAGAPRGLDTSRAWQ